jgi:methylated-DNA-protein-cysteine methyltransferase-like protein
MPASDPHTPTGADHSGRSLLNKRVYAVVRAIPPGKVLTYSGVARLIGVGRGARAVGWALLNLGADSDVPWQRVINVKGYISNKSSPEAPLIQRERLEAEGIRFADDGQVDLAIFLWQPDPFEIQAILAAAGLL